MSTWKTYLKLVHLEICRFRYVLAALMILTAGIQLWGFHLTVNGKLFQLSEEMRTNPRALEEIAAAGNYLSFKNLLGQNAGLTNLTIVGVMTILLIYSLMIWYLDWFGRSTFIYRLLMLPHPRFSIYLAKFTAMLIFVFSMLSLQVLTLVLELAWFNHRIPVEIRWPSTFIDGIRFTELSLFLPPSWLDFLTTYAAGSVLLLVVFTTVLLERSYRWMGLLAGIVWIGLLLIVLGWIYLSADRLLYLLPSEWLLLSSLILTASAVLALWLGRKLIVSKITV